MRVKLHPNTGAKIHPNTFLSENKCTITFVHLEQEGVKSQLCKFYS